MGFLKIWRNIKSPKHTALDQLKLSNTVKFEWKKKIHFKTKFLCKFSTMCTNSLKIRYFHWVSTRNAGNIRDSLNLSAEKSYFFRANKKHPPISRVSFLRSLNPRSKYQSGRGGVPNLGVYWSDRIGYPPPSVGPRADILRRPRLLLGELVAWEPDHGEGLPARGGVFGSRGSEYRTRIHRGKIGDDERQKSSPSKSAMWIIYICNYWKQIEMNM